MTEVILTSGSSWTVPNDCTSATVECIGGGQGGNATNGGNGGDYAKANAVALTPGASIAIAIGVGGAGVASGSQNAGGDTSFGAAVLAKGGGSASADVGDTTFAGGAGNASGAGGGAAGPSGAGGAASGTTGGQGDGTVGGAGGTSGNAGAAGTEWGTAGSGGGGGAVAAAGLTVVATALGTPSSGQASGASATFSNVQAGDQIIAFYFSGGRLSITFTFSDDQGNTYSTSPITPLTEGMYQAAVATVSANAASLTVSVSAPNSTPTMYALLARGKTLSVDTANVQGTRYANLGAAAATAGPYSMSAAGLLLAILSESDETSTDITLTGATGYVADQSNDSYNRTKMVHKITSGAVSGESFQFTATGAASTNDPAYYIVPFTAA